MRRPLLNITTASSLLLCLGVLVLWVRSFQRTYGLAIRWCEPIPDSDEASERWFWSLEVEDGGLWCRWSEDLGSMHREPPPLFRRWHVFSSPAGERIYLLWSADNPANWRLGFVCGATSSFMPNSGLRVPLWLPALLTLMPLAAWSARRTQRRRQKARGLCLHCGYDLRASRERCPECGTPILQEAK